MSELGMVNMRDIENMTLVEYRWRNQAKREREFSRMEEVYYQAYLNTVAESTEKVGNNIEPKYKTFGDFFNADKVYKAIMGVDDEPEDNYLTKLMIEANTLYIGGDIK